MGWGSLSGRARVDPSRPRAWGCCDRCGMWYGLDQLVWQHEYRGNDLINIQLRVCTLTCLDTPFQNDRPLYMPPDPPPVDQPRVETFALDESGPQIWDSNDIYYQPQEDYDSSLDWDNLFNTGGSAKDL